MGLLTSLRGRINRGKFWLAFVITLVLALILLALISKMTPWHRLFTIGPDGVPVAGPDGMPLVNYGAPGMLPYWIAIGVVYLVFIYLQLAVAVKRCHDRNKSGWWCLLFLPSILAAIYVNYSLFRNGILSVTELMGEPAFLTAYVILAIAGFGAFVWWLIDLGVLKGTVGPNRFGPDPLAGH